MLLTKKGDQTVKSLIIQHFNPIIPAGMMIITILKRIKRVGSNKRHIDIQNFWSLTSKATNRKWINKRFSSNASKKETTYNNIKNSLQWDKY